MLVGGREFEVVDARLSGRLTLLQEQDEVMVLEDAGSAAAPCDMHRLLPDLRMSRTRSYAGPESVGPMMHNPGDEDAQHIGCSLPGFACDAPYDQGSNHVAYDHCCSPALMAQ